jgi:3-phytase
MKLNAALLILAFGLALLSAGPRVGVVAPVAETTPARGTDDAADDPAIWVNPDDPMASLVLGTNKKEGGGLQVLDLSGRERQFLRTGRLNNVDLRSGFSLNGEETILAGATNRSRDTMDFFTLDPQRRSVTHIASIPAGQPRVYGFCLHHSPVSGRFHAIVTFEGGPVRQYELRTSGSELTAVPVRSFGFDSTAEGCVADDTLGHLYIAEELAGLWKTDADPVGGTAVRQVDSIGSDGHLTADAEGVAIYRAGAASGYIIVSSQGDDTFALYDRAGDNAYLGSFRVTDSIDIDGVTGTDGIAVTSTSLGPRFPEGLVVVHDQDNAGSDTSNFKYLSWAHIARALGLPPSGRERR